MKTNTTGKHHNSHSLRKGFTLIELLVVIAIIVSLAAVSSVVVGKAMKKTRSATAVSSLLELNSMLTGMIAENGNMPIIGETAESPSWDARVLEYMDLDDVEFFDNAPPKVPLKYEELFYHPSDNKKKSSKPRRTFAYFANLSGLVIGSDITDPGKTAIIGERPWQNKASSHVGSSIASTMDAKKLIADPKTGKELNPSGKFNFLFVDGHVEQLTPEDSFGSGNEENPAGVWTAQEFD